MNLSSSIARSDLLHSVVAHASDGIVVVDFDGYVLLANPAATEIFQMDDLCGAPFGFPVVVGHSAEVDILRRDGTLGTAEMRISEGRWDSESDDGRDRERVFIAMLRDITERKRMEIALQDARDELAALHDCAPLGVVALGEDGRVSLWNRAAETILGWSEAEILGSHVSALSEPLREMLRGLEENTGSADTIVGKETRHLRRDGIAVDISVSLAAVHHPPGNQSGVVCIVEDISRRVSDAERLRMSAKIFENTQEGILITDARGVVQSVNQAFVAVTGYSREEALGKTPNLLRSGRHDSAFYDEMWRALLEQGQWRGEIWNRRKNGEIYPEWLHVSAIRDDRGEVANYVALFSDISKVKENEEKLKHLAHFDSLTDLPNRFLFQDHVELALAQAARANRQVALLFLDLDRFKTINDTLGHRAGDSLLIEVGRRLAGCLRAGDTLSRIGGDEFNVLLPDLDNGSAAAAVADKFIAALGEPFRVDGQEVHVTTSVGIAVFPQNGTHLDELRSAADAAMFQAKAQGRNTYRFHQAGAHDADLARRFLLENQLRRALERGELSVVYQPEVDIASERITGMEALMRWTHPELGEIPPTEFIPMAEEIGIIATLGNWVLREACRQNKAWQLAGHAPLCVSVNVSPYQLRDRRLVDTVADVLSETGLEGRWLELELTEGSFLKVNGESLDILKSLKQFGVRLSIDDFGTGYSSLGYLRHFPIDTLKIDRSFISQIASNAGDAAISRAIVDIARSLELRVVAEGVESQEQLGVLRELKCGDVQGFYFSRPLPPDQFGELSGGFRRPLSQGTGQP